MSYAICNVICGCELPEEIRSYLDEVDHGYDDLGVTETYSAGGEPSVYCGVDLCEFDETENQPVSNLTLTPTKAQVAKATKMLADLRTKFEKVWREIEADQEEADKQGEKELKALLNTIPKKPDVLLIWSSS